MVATKKKTTTITGGADKKPKKSISNPAVLKDDEPSTVIYLGHIPNGFFEAEMKKFFAQFGPVVRVKHFRSSKTGGSKGYAFVEFSTSDVAQVVGEAMNGYFLGERRLVSHVVPKSKIHDGMFKKPKIVIEDDVSNGDDKVREINMAKHRTSLRQKQKRLREKGIDFEIAIPV
jgi:nucleolar protein 15